MLMGILKHVELQLPTFNPEKLINKHKISFTTIFIYDSHKSINNDMHFVHLCATMLTIYQKKLFFF